MLRIGLLALLIGLGACSRAMAAEPFPYRAKVRASETMVRSGPGEDRYPTSRLQRGAEVEVYRHDGPWLAIRPPAGAFSLVERKHLRPLQGGLAEVRAAIPAWVGTSVAEPAEPKSLVTLEPGEVVQFFEHETAKAAEEPSASPFHRIAPPAGEFRWIHRDALAEQPAEPASQPPEPPAEPPSPLDEIFESPPNPMRASVPGDHEWEARDEAAIDSAAADLEVKLALLAAGDLNDRRLEQVRDQALDLLENAPTTEARSRARNLLRRIDHFENLLVRRRQLDQQQTLGGAPAVSGKVALVAAAEPLKDSGADDNADKHRPSVLITPADEASDGTQNAPQYDGQGWLMPVRTRRQTAPPFALLNDAGEVLHFVTPAPGLNLHRYARQRVGIFGRQSRAKQFNEPHLTALRVVLLRRHETK